MRERREQEQHIPRNAEQRHSRAKKTHEKKQQKKKGKTTKTDDESRGGQSPTPPAKVFLFFLFLVVETHTSAAGGLEIISKKKTAQNLFLISSRGHFRAKKEIREPVPIQSVECRKKLSVPKSAECEGKSPGGAEYLRETFQEENQKENPKSVQQFACRLPAAQRSLVLVSVVL